VRLLADFATDVQDVLIMAEVSWLLGAPEKTRAR
jgi:hypothetical protein